MKFGIEPALALSQKPRFQPQTMRPEPGHESSNSSVLEAHWQAVPLIAKDVGAELVPLQTAVKADSVIVASGWNAAVIAKVFNRHVGAALRLAPVGMTECSEQEKAPP